MIGSILWLSMVLLSGIGLGSLLKVWEDNDSSSIKLGWASCLGFAYLAIASFIRLTVNQNMLYGPAFYDIIGGSILLFLFGLMKDHSFFQRPTREDYRLLAVAVLPLVVFLVFYFSIFPIFPEFDSADFHVHVNNAVMTTTGVFPLEKSILYGGMIYLLGLAVRLDASNPLIVTRQAMGIMVVLSVFVFNLCVSKLFGKDKAFWATILYVGSGFIWFGYVFNSGLYPNFFGVLSSLFLVVSVINLFESKSPSAYILFLLSLATLALSHYSSLLIIPTVLSLAILKLKSHTTKSLFLLCSIAIPTVYLVFGPLQLLAHIPVQGSGNPILPLTPLASALGTDSKVHLIPTLWPAFQYIISEMYSDFAAIPIFFLSALFFYRLFKTRDAKMIIPAGWFISSLAFVIGDAAWRFAMSALVPLTLMAGFGLAMGLGKLQLTKRQRNWYPPPIYRALHLQNRHAASPFCAFSILLIILTVSLTNLSFSPAFVEPRAFSQSQSQVYEALQWFHANSKCEGQLCSFVTPTDWELTYSDDLFGNPSYFLCSLVTDPQTASYFAVSKNATYLIVTNRETCTPFPCPSPIQLNVNSTRGKALEINMTGYLPDGTKALLTVNKTAIANATFFQNRAQSIIHFKNAGVYDIVTYVGTKPSWTMRVWMGTEYRPHSIPWSYTACLPWNWSSQDLFGAKMVWSNSNVKIWCLAQGCE